tara:strand:- start:341 stop:1795 length:1455 start_codon:yes stop_codon:yes gene_type:complete
MPFVDRPGRSGRSGLPGEQDTGDEWGMVPTDEGPSFISETTKKARAVGQGRMIFGDTVAQTGSAPWLEAIDPKNLPRADIGTSEERREAASSLGGLKSDRQRPNILKEIARSVSGMQLLKPSREVRNPRGVKDLISRTRLPPAWIKALGKQDAPLTVRENTRDLSIKEKVFTKSPSTNERPWGSIPVDFYTSNTYDEEQKKLHNEIHITSKGGFHTGAARPSTVETVTHELGHGLSDMMSRASEEEKVISMQSGPRTAKGSDPHEEAIADAVTEMYGPKGPAWSFSGDRPAIYGFDGGWKGEDPLVRHSYETTKLKHKATMGEGSEPKGEAHSEGLDPQYGTLKRLTDPDSPYVRTMYSTRYQQGGADYVELKEEDVPWREQEKEDIEFDLIRTLGLPNRGSPNRNYSINAGTDYRENVLNKIQIEPAVSNMGGPFRGEQQSMFPDIVPHQDLRENVRELDAENQRSGEDHLNRVKSNLKTWLV